MKVREDNDMGRLPSDWPLVAVEDAFRFTKKPRAVDYASFPEIAFVPMELVPLNGVHFDSYVLKPSDAISSGTYFEAGDVLIAKITPSFENGKQGIIKSIPNGFGVATTEVIPINGVKGRSNRYYLSYYLLKDDVRRSIAGKMEGSTGRQRVPVGVLRRLPVPLPPLPEQKKIAAVLSKLQRAIDVQERLIQSLRDLKKSAMNHLFTHGLRGEKLKKTEIGMMPKIWAIGRIGTACQIRGSTIALTDLPSLDTGDLSDAFVHGIKVSDMNLQGNGTAINRANLEVRLPKATAERKTVPANAIVFPKRGAAIGTNKKRVTTTWTVLDPNLIAVVPGSGIATDYLFNWFTTFDLLSLQDPGPTPQLNKKDLEPVQFPLPSLAEQTEIAHILQTIDKKLENHESQKASLQALFKTMLNKLMTGQVRVKDLDIDTAEVEVA